LQEIINRSGFGFVWAVFAAHCHLPAVYPLYDQHVYRAYKAIQSDGNDIPDLAPTIWEEYRKYCEFFWDQMKVANLSQVESDRALWSYGKNLKIKKISTQNRQGRRRENIAIYPDPQTLDDYVHSQTLGGKAKSFWWEIDEENKIRIYRNFNLRTGLIIDFKKVTDEEIDALFEYLKQFEGFYLANNVSNLGDDTERKNGIGYFFHNKCKWSIKDSQLASHIAAIFVDSGVWTSNGKKINIQFQFKSIDNWRDLVRQHYSELQLIDEE
jgi:hypothetical protein